MSNTHSLFIQGNGFTAFMDGIPDTCDHDWTGDTVFFTQSGKTIYWHTYRAWASLCSDARNELIQKKHNHKSEDPIVGGAVSCKKCKKIFSPPMY